MEFTETAREQAHAMVTGLLDGEGSLFRIDTEDTGALEQLWGMMLIGGQTQRMEAGLAIPFFIVEPARLGIDVDDGSLALVGPGVTSVDEVADDLTAAVTGATVAGCLLSADDDVVHLVAQRSGDNKPVSFVLAEAAVRRTSLDADSPLLSALAAGLAEHGV